MPANETLSHNVTRHDIGVAFVLELVIIPETVPRLLYWNVRMPAMVLNLNVLTIPANVILRYA